MICNETDVAIQSKALIWAMANDASIYRATRYLSEKFTVKVTRMFKPEGRSRSFEYRVTAGTPNYAERAFIKVLKKAGEPFPVKDIQFKFYPTTIKRKAA